MPVSAGEVLFDGQSLRGRKPHMIARSGIARTFQIVQPFAEMSVLENVMAGALYAANCSMAEARSFALECLAFTRLDALRDAPAAQLALANRKRLELAKSLAMRPRILMLDEVNAGLNSSEIDEAIGMIRRIAERGVTIIVIEHLMRVVRSLAQRTVVLHHGAVVSAGPTDAVFDDPQVIEAYLGSKFAKRFAAEQA